MSRASSTDGPWIERDFHARFLEIARESPESLAARAADVLAGDGPDCEKVALLRALSDSGSPRTSEFLVRAIEEPSGTATPGRESVASFALRTLTSRAAHDSSARLGLERVAWGSTDGADRCAPDLRRRSVAALSALATTEEAFRIAGYLAVEVDGMVRADGVEALSANPLAAEALLAFGLDSAPTIAPIVDE